MCVSRGTPMSKKLHLISFQVGVPFTPDQGLLVAAGA